MMPMNRYTTKQLNYIWIGYVLMPIPELTVRFNARFGANKTESQIHSCIKNHRFVSGRDGRFEKGQNPWNTGTKGMGICLPNSGNFKKGSVPKNRRPLGSERVDSKDGYILVKIPERDPHTGSPTRFKNKHVIVWEQLHGPVPEGKAVAFKDGNQINCAPENLMLVSRAELLRLNKYRYKGMPDDLKPSVLALAQMEVKTFELSRRERA